MAYLAPIHQPSSVRHALKLNFLAPETECLAVAKANRLEFFVQAPDGLVLRHSKAVYGRVTILNKIRPASSPTDHLFVGTDRQMYFTLSWNAETKQLRTERAYVDQADPSARDTQTGDRCHIDPNGRLMTLELYEGIVTVIPIIQKQRKSTDPEVGTLGDPTLLRIPELFVRSSAFIQTRGERGDKPKLALLYEDTQKRVRLKVRKLDYTPSSDGAGNIADEEEAGLDEDLELGATHLIPVPGPASGVLVLGETSITYYEPSTNYRLKTPLKDATIFVAWEQIDDQRFVFADEYGKLYLFMLEISSPDKVHGWKLDEIGETSRASVLIYLGNGNVYVGSHQGDSQVINIKPQSMDVIQTFPNIAPILDFTIMDMGSRNGEGQTNEYSSGQARLVTGSGAYNDGSLRSVRSGVGLEDLGLLGQMDNITDLFSIKSDSESSFVDTIVVSFVDETRLFRFNAEGEVEELEEFNGLSLNKGTLLASNVSNGRMLQATASSVCLSDLESGMIVSEWSPSNDQKITAVTANDETVVVSIGGTNLVVLDMRKDLAVRVERNFGSESQVACLNSSQANPSICTVGFWQNSSIAVLSLTDLSTTHTEVVVEDGVTVPRSLLLVNLLEGQSPTLLVAMADGNVVTYSMDRGNGTLSGKKTTILGTQQANFRALPRGDGLSNVFATCEHASLIYGSEGRIVFSAVTAEKATCVCPFDSECYPGAIAIASTNDLKISLVDEERSTHVQGLHVGSTVRRLTYSPELKAFGLGTIKRTLESGVEIVKSHFKLADEVKFNILATYPLNQDELVESVLRAQLNDGSGGLAERFVVGTAYLDDENEDAIRGRILVFEFNEDRKLKLLTEHAVKGACRCLAVVDGKIIAALIKTVVLYSYEYPSGSKPRLVKSASFRTSTAPMDLSVEGNIIAIADLMKSVSLVEYQPGEAGKSDTLTEVARHFQTLWSTSVAKVDRDTYLESDAEGNLLVLTRDVKGVTLEDRRRLQVTSEMCLGEMVNKIRRIDVDALADAIVIPRAFLATVEGSIYLFALISDSKKDLLMRLQSSIAQFVQSPGDVPFLKYRAFRNQVREAGEPFRFVDGELVERFLDVDEALQKEIVAGLGMDNVELEDIRSMVESLRKLR